MATQDIYELITTVLNKNTKEDVNGLYNLSQTNKYMKNLVNYNTDYDDLKKLVHFQNICKALWETIGKAIDKYTNEENKIDIENAKRTAFENIEYIIPYVTNKDIIDINYDICIMFLDYDDMDMPHNYRNKYLLIGKILCDFIKRVDSKYKIILLTSAFVKFYNIPISREIYNNHIISDILQNDFDSWLSRL